MTDWTAADIPDQSGRVAVVTGASSGLGLETTAALAAHGATVVMVARSPERLASAQRTVRARVPDAELRTAAIDLGSLDSVRVGATSLLASFGRLDLLFDNAGLMAPPRAETADGFESQFGINHLGHFALTGLLLPALAATPASRVVAVTSAMRRIGRIGFDDLNSERGYHRWAAYGQSKLANLVFAVELDRRLRHAGAETIAVAAHPGYAATNLQAGHSWLETRLFRVGNALFAQPGYAGAWPLLYVGTAPGVTGGELYGPSGPGKMRGHPRRERLEAKAIDPVVGRRLWEASVAATGVDYAGLVTGPSF